MLHVNYNDIGQPEILKKDFLGSKPTFKNHNCSDVMQFYRKKNSKSRVFGPPRGDAETDQ